MEYVVIRSFTDKETQEHYAVGDNYPHCGLADEERVAELSTVTNRRGVILIEAKKAAEKAEKVEKVEKVEETMPKKTDDLTREKVQSMPFFKVKSVAQANGIDVDGKKTAELRAEVIEVLGL